MLYVLLIDTDETFARALTDQLPRYDAKLTWVRTREEALAELRGCQDAVVLGVDSPGLDGFTLATAIRRVSSLPLVMTSASNDLERQIVGLSLGADDYLTRPFSTRVLWARIQAHVRRTRGELGPGLETIEVGPLEIDRRALVVRLRGRALGLTSDELTLMRVLAEQRGRVLTREQLLDQVKGSAEEAFDRAIDVRISRLRRKLGEDASLIRTIRGVGYTLVAEAADGPRALAM